MRCRSGRRHTTKERRIKGVVWFALLLRRLIKEWALAQTEKRRIKIDAVGSYTKSDSPPGARDGRQGEEFLVPTVPKARRPTAQPKDSGPRDGVNNPETRPDVLATHQVMFLIAVTTTLTTETFRV